MKFLVVFSAIVAAALAAPQFGFGGSGERFQITSEEKTNEKTIR